MAVKVAIRDDEEVATTDLELLERYFRKNDLQAIEILFVRHTDTAYRIALAHFHHSMDAEDAVQMAFLQVLVKGNDLLNGDQRETNVRGWIMKIVVNCCRMKMRDESRRREREDAVELPEHDLPADHEADELKATAVRMVKALPSHYRLPVWMHFLEGLSCGDISNILGLPEATVRKQISRGLNQVRGSLQASGLALGITNVSTCLTAVSLPPAPVVLAGSWKAFIAKYAVPPSNAGLTVKSAGASKTGAASIKIAGAVAVLLIAAFALKGYVSKRGNNTAPIASQNAPVSIDAPSAQNKRLNAVYRRAYVSEVLYDLNVRTGLRSAFPGTIAYPDVFTPGRNVHSGRFTFSMDAKDISAEEILSKLSEEGNLVLERHEKEVVLWTKAPDELFSALQTQFKQGTAEERCEALYRIARLDDKRIYPLLFGALENQDKAVIAQSVFGLAERHLATLCYGENVALAADRLRALIAAPDNKAYLRAMICVLGATRDPRAVDWLLPLLDSPDAYTRGNAALGLGLTRNAKVVAPLALLLKKESNSYVRQCVARALAQIDDPKTLETLVSLTSDSNIAVRFSAVQSLGKMRDSRAVESLILLAGGAAEMRVGAIGALAQMDDARAAKYVAEALKDKVFLRLWMAAAESYNPRLIEPLKDLVNNADPSTLPDAAIFLCEMGDPRAVPPVSALAKLLKTSSDTAVRARTAIALGYTRASAAIEALLATMNDSNPTIVHAVLVGLNASRDPIAIKKAIEILRKNETAGSDEFPALDKFASNTSAELIYPFQLRAEKTNDIKLDIKLAIAEGSSEISNSAIDLAIAGMNASAKSTRKEALVLAGKSRNARLFDPIAKLLNDSDATIRASAAQALWAYPVRSLDALAKYEAETARTANESSTNPQSATGNDGQF